MSKRETERRLAALEAKIDPEPLIINILTFFEDEHGNIASKTRLVVTIIDGETTISDPT